MIKIVTTTLVTYALGWSLCAMDLDRLAAREQNHRSTRATIIQRANSRLNDYYQLSPYLYQELKKVIDQGKSYNSLKHAAIMQWIENHAFGCEGASYAEDSEDDIVVIGGNVPALYYYFKTNFKYGICDAAIVMTVSDQNQTFIALILCLMRTAFDMIKHYSVHHNASILQTNTNAYALFKRKFHYLLTTYLQKNKTLKDLPDFNTCCKGALEHWQNNQWHMNEYPYTWIETFQWYNAYMPASFHAGWRIWFGRHALAPTAPSLQISQRMAMEMVSDESRIDTLTTALFDNQATSWEDFFKDYSFPIKQETLDKLFPKRTERV